MDTLVLCSGCSRHVRANEAACPFCGSRLGAEPARRFAPIGSSASRSRRYALRAALLAGSATASCSQSTGTTQGAGGAGLLDASGSGGASAQGGANQGGASGGTAGRGGTASGGASGGGAGNGGVGGGALVPGRACPGFADGDPARVCRSPTDCPPRNGFTTHCVNRPSTSQCPIVAYADVQECGPTVPCAPDWECRSLPCNARACFLTAPCSDQNCHGDRRCVDGACMPIPCDQPGGQKCLAGLACIPNAPPGQPFCEIAQCTNGYACPPPLACGLAYPNVHGCGGTTCDKDADCACGYCVNRACAPQLGACDYQILQMPYGCVWPDEELV